jgi:hypothetical protein
VSTPAPTPDKPAGLNLAILIAGVLAALEISGAIQGLATSRDFQAAPADGLQLLPGDQQALREHLARFQARMRALKSPRRMLALAALSLPVALATIAAAVQLNRRKRQAVRWLSYALAALLVVLVIDLVMAVQMFRVMQSFANELPRALVPPGAVVEVAESPGAVLVALVTGPFAFVLAWHLAQIAGCLHALRQVGRPEVRAWAS